MPQLKNKISSTLQYISAFLFLALMCSNQAFQFSHLHHFHEDDTLAFEGSSITPWDLWLNILRLINMAKKDLHIPMTTGTTMRIRQSVILHGHNLPIL